MLSAQNEQSTFHLSRTLFPHSHEDQRRAMRAIAYNLQLAEMMQAAEIFKQALHEVNARDSWQHLFSAKQRVQYGVFQRTFSCAENLNVGDVSSPERSCMSTSQQAFVSEANA